MEIKRELDLDPFSLTDTQVTPTLLPPEWLCRYLIASPCRWCGLDADAQKECFLSQKDRPSWNGPFSLILSSSWLWGFDQKQPSLVPTQAGIWGSTMEPLSIGEFWRHWFLKMGHSASMGAWPQSRASTEVCLFFKKPGTRQSRSCAPLFFETRSLSLSEPGAYQFGKTRWQPAPGTLLPVSDSMAQALSPLTVYTSAGNTLGSSSP